MAIDYAGLKAWPFPDIERRYTWQDTALYALGLGLGQDPVDPAQLRHVYEDGLAALPTMGVVLATPGFWLKNPATGVNWTKVLHGEQGLTMHRPLKPEGRVIGRTRIDEIVDKGAAKGAMLYSSRDLVDAEDGGLICTLTSTTVLRGDGGFGGPAAPGPGLIPATVSPPFPAPDGAPDATFDWPVSPNAALLYRLSGDYNPVHADPAVAAQAGFAKPILHGLATFGIAGHAILRLLCHGAPERLRRLDVRFTAPAYPGETLRTEVWRQQPGLAAFRVRAVERDVIVLNNGRAGFDV